MPITIEPVTQAASVTSVGSTQPSNIGDHRLQKCSLVINSKLSFEFVGVAYPNAWLRFWYKFLLGWEWRK